jgi:hypothetical protein
MGDFYSDVVELSEWDSEQECTVEVEKGNLAKHFGTKTYPLVGWSRRQFARTTEIEPNYHWKQDFTPVFLGHARLYAFAHMHLVAELRYLALHKLHQTLKRFTLYASGCFAIVELARYVYNDVMLPERERGKIDQLRELVVEYAALNVEHFSGEEGA